MGLSPSARTSAAAFLVSVLAAIETSGVAAAVVFSRCRMRIRLFLGGMPATALAGRQAFVEIDLPRHLLSPLVSTDPSATWISPSMESDRADGGAIRVRECH